jgi:predicted cupin superfamily sugar epimerase
MNAEAAALIRALGLAPHPEGGWYRETWRAEATFETGRGLRAAGTSIYYLLADGAVSRLHTLASDEVWHHHRGDPVSVHLFGIDGYREARLGDATESQPAWQAVAPTGTAFGAEVAVPGGWALLGCTVAPGFSFVDFAWADLEALRRLHPARAEVIARLG